MLVLRQLLNSWTSAEPSPLTIEKQVGQEASLFRPADPAPDKVAHALLLLAAEAVNLLGRLVVEVRLERVKEGGQGSAACFARVSEQRTRYARDRDPHQPR